MFDWFKSKIDSFSGKTEEGEQEKKKTSSSTSSVDMFAFGGKVAFKKQSAAPKQSGVGYDYLFKYVIIGDSGVGKSCLLKQFTERRFFSESYVSTIGCEFASRTLTVDGQQVKVQVWDTTGQERFRAISRAYYRGASGVLCVYDVTNRRSFEDVKAWIDEIDTYSGSEEVAAVVILVGNKIDIEGKRQVTVEEGKKLADSLGLPFVETSAKTGFAVEETFVGLSKGILKRVEEQYGRKNRDEGGKDEGEDSDDEFFDDSELKTDLENLMKKNPSAKTSADNKKHHKTDVNVFKIDLSTLEKDAELLTGDPTACSHCGVLLNAKSRIVNMPRDEVLKFVAKKTAEKNKKKTKLATAPPLAEKYLYLLERGTELHPSDSDSTQYWHCEFCDEFNAINLDEEEIPKSGCVDYLVSAPQVTIQKGDILKDISGSMCITQELDGKLNLRGSEKRSKENQEMASGHGDQYLPGQKRNTTHVSRLQCLQSAIEQQINTLEKEFPNKKVGLITFNNEVTLIGDGTQPPVVIAGDKLDSFKELLKLGVEFSITKSVKESKDKLLEKLWSLEETGSTALGPALLLGIAVAGSEQRSKVILCTDGLANTGIGSLEGKETDYTPFYTELAEQAKVKGVAVSVLSFIGTDCNLAHVGVVSEQSGGEIERVDPLKITSNMSSIINTKVLAYNAMAMVILHRGLRFRGEMEDENENRNYHLKDLGNVTAESECSFSYGFRSKQECDLTGVTTIPFQLQLIYTRPDGMKILRVATSAIGVTEDRQTAEDNADVKVIGTHAVTRAARYAKDGNFEAAQLETRAAQRFMRRNKLEAEKMEKWNKQTDLLDNMLQVEQLKEEQMQHLDTVELQKQRQALFSDDATTTIAKQTKVTAKALF